MNRIILTLTAAVLIAASSPVHAADYIGTVTGVDDGDSFHMDVDNRDVHIRLCGIDSPERGKPGYGKGAGALATMIEGKLVHCLQVGMGTPCDGRSKPFNHNRPVAQCFIGDKDIAAEMVKLRQACDWPHFSGGHYRIDLNTCVRQGR